MSDVKDAKYWADWLVDAVATSTQNRMFLRGEPECDTVACDAIQMNGKKAIENTIRFSNACPDPKPNRADSTMELIAEIEDMKAENERLREALEPSCETKAAYMGEFNFPIEVSGEEDDDGNTEYVMQISVPWTTIKDIMSAIRARAALGSQP